MSKFSLHHVRPLSDFHIYHRDLSLWAPISFVKEKSSLEQGGVWLLFSQVSLQGPRKYIFDS